MTSHKITQDGREGGKKNETVQNRSKGKLTRNETQNSYGLISDSTCYETNPFQHVLYPNGLNSPSTPPDTNKTQLAFGHRERFITNTNQQ